MNLNMLVTIKNVKCYIKVKLSKKLGSYLAKI